MWCTIRWGADPLRLDEIYDDALELGLRGRTSLTDTLYAMRDSMAGQPRAAHYDGESSSRQWCWTHSRDVQQCHREDLGCTGETFTLHDPVGEAAVTAAEGGDPATRAHRELIHLVKLYQRTAERIVQLSSEFQPRKHTDYERAGIGYCACGKYCDGTSSNRLRVGQCPACAVRHYRRTTA